MLTKAYKISKIITSLTMFVGVLAIIIACIFVYRRSEKTKGMSVNKFYSDVDTSEFTEKELDILNERKQMLF